MSSVSTDVDCTVIGAGVVGLAIARAFAASGYDTLVLERESNIGTGVSSRNSEVIHAGIYYEPGSIKARTCLRGRKLLYQFCDARNIDYRRCGKLIVAQSAAQLGELERLAATAKLNQVADLTFLDARRATQLEPQLTCHAALLSPSTGIVDSHGFMMALLADAERNNAVFAFNNPLRTARIGTDHIALFGEHEDTVARTRLLVNAAGLDAWNVARAIEEFPKEHIPPMYLAKGSYFTLQRARSPFTRLIYPVPEPGGLGVHVTLDLSGRARFGPDVEWIQSPLYEVDECRAANFYAAIRTYWSGLKDGQLAPGYAGIRPKLAGPGMSNADFLIQGPAQHRSPGIINLFGIESPGLTASLAIAEEVLQMARAV